MKNIKPIRETASVEPDPLTAIEEMRLKMAKGEGLAEGDLQGLTQLDLISLIEDPFGHPNWRAMKGCKNGLNSPVQSKEWKKAVIKVLRTEINMRLRRGAKQLHGWGDA